MTKDGTIDEELTKDNIIQIEGWVWDTNVLSHPDTKEAKGRSGWKSGMVLVKISDLERLGFIPKEADKIVPEKSATPPICCLQPMKLYSSSISHDAYHCEKCGRAVQTKGGWGNKELMKDGFENPFPLIPFY